MKKTPYSVNGKFFGALYELSDGRKVFLAHRMQKHMVKNQAWSFNRSILDKLHREGVTCIGVVMRKAGKILYWLTTLTSFELRASPSFDGMPGLALEGKHFKIHPGNSDAALEKLTSIK